MIMYTYPQRSNEIYHFGIKGRSGRYPYGSGERPYQDREQARRQKNLAVGRERLANRINRANKMLETDKYSRKIGWENTQKAGKAHEYVKDIKEISKEILSDDDRTAKLGQYTRAMRAIDVALTSVGSTLVFGGGSLAVAGLGLPASVMALPIAGSAAVAYKGYKYYQKTKY